MKTTRRVALCLGLAMLLNFVSTTAHATRMSCFLITDPGPIEITMTVGERLDLPVFMVFDGSPPAGTQVIAEVRPSWGGFYMGNYEAVVANDTSYTSRVNMPSPPAAGAYTLEFRCIIDHYSWTEDTQFYTVDVSAVPSDGGGTSCDADDDVRASDWDLVSGDTIAEQEFCFELELWNRGVCDFEIDEVDLDHESGPSAWWDDDEEGSDFTLSDDEENWIGDPFCVTVESPGLFCFNVDLYFEDGTSDGNVDVFCVQIRAPNPCDSVFLFCDTDHCEGDTSIRNGHEAPNGTTCSCAYERTDCNQNDTEPDAAVNFCHADGTIHSHQSFTNGYCADRGNCLTKIDWTNDQVVGNCADYCLGTNILVANRGCGNGQCGTGVGTSCLWGCEMIFGVGANCKNDPCGATNCSDRCEGNTLTTGQYCDNGACVGGHSQTCAWGCNSDTAACNSNPCAGIDCEDHCEGDVLVTGESCTNGLCGNGIEMNCAWGCSETDGAHCNADPCTGVVCNSTCVPGNVRKYNGRPVADDATCSCVYDTEDCDRHGRVLPAVPYCDGQNLMTHQERIMGVCHSDACGQESSWVNPQRVQTCGTTEECFDGSCVSCSSDWICTEFPPCGHAGDVVHRTCIDRNNCRTPTNQPTEGLLCGEDDRCRYTSIEWQEPLDVPDGDPASALITWTGDCSGDQKHIRLEEVTLRNRAYGPNAVLIDPFGFYRLDGQQAIPLTAFYVDHPFDRPRFKIVLADYWIDGDGEMQHEDLVESSNRLYVQHWSADATLEDYVREARLNYECSGPLTVTDACFEYWAEMEVEMWEERQFEIVFDIMDAVWKGSCAACGTAAVLSDVWLVLAADVTAALAPEVVLATAAVCNICTGGAISPFTAEEVSYAVIAAKINGRISVLGSEGTIGTTSYISARGGFVAYQRDAVNVVEVFGLTSRGVEGLTFTKTIHNFPGIVEGSYELIELHRGLAPVKLGAFQVENALANPATAQENMRALVALVENGHLKAEAEYAWWVHTGGKIGDLRDVGVTIQPLLNHPRNLYGVYNTETKVISLVAKPGSMPTAAGGTIPRVESVQYFVLPHEIGHAGTFNLITSFIDPSGQPYRLAHSEESYWVSEIFNDITYRFVIQNDHFRYENYVDGAYGLIHDQGADRFVDDALASFRIGFSGERAFELHGHYLLHTAEVGDRAVAEQIRQRIRAELGQEYYEQILAEQQQHELDAVALQNGLVTTPGFQASDSTDRLLRHYRFVESRSSEGGSAHSDSDDVENRDGLGNQDAGSTVRDPVPVFTVPDSGRYTPVLPELPGIPEHDAGQEDTSTNDFPRNDGGILNPGAAIKMPNDNSAVCTGDECGGGCACNMQTPADANVLFFLTGVGVLWRRRKTTHRAS